MKAQAPKRTRRRDAAMTTIALKNHSSPLGFRVWDWGVGFRAEGLGPRFKISAFALLRSRLEQKPYLDVQGVAFHSYPFQPAYLKSQDD